jgi:uncharacterized Zn finger protein (UPF0148 family)
VCRACGILLDGPGRVYCPDCLPQFKAERTAKLATAAKEVLSQMRASPHDPAQSKEARRKRIDKAREMSLAARACEREHGPAADPTAYEREILPKIQSMSVPRLAMITGLSDYYYGKFETARSACMLDFGNTSTPPRAQSFARIHRRRLSQIGHSGLS